jgi:outer membrane lipoprotein
VSLLRTLLTLLAGLSLAGCVGNPPKPDAALAAQPTPAQVAASAKLPAGARLTWGGLVQSVHNFADSTRLEVLSYPLNADRQPITSLPAGGRFMLEMRGFLEPHDFPQGTAITAEGYVTRVLESRVGQAPYRFPLLKGERLEVWAQQQAAESASSPSVRWSLGVGTSGSGVGVGIGF